ncbi:hypothetical protein OS188_09400 [Xanthomarina sp. F1114]|uniref:hypothetical protein n=1 Tax=Xanthomarina sp. F1114 TaxID=2996019 RepID=UPI00225DF04B|nr:hypothetical protein [Xanthomarina sp. F1114]MCX7548168.1 hypothetical protein [Xanthomarina sp. F1114]
MKSLLLTFSLVVFTSSVFSQAAFAKLEKNKNLLASSLFHELNSTKDTLLLQSKNEISHVYSLNAENEKEIDVYLNTTSTKISLVDLSPGKHVFIVDQTPKKILFVIRVLGYTSLLATDD